MAVLAEDLGHLPFDALDRLTPGRYGVLSLPTVMVFSGGAIVETIDGAQPRRRYAEAVARALAA